MFCSNCGKEITEGSQFCGNCGTAVNGVKNENTKKVVSKEQDNNVVLSVKPKFKIYVILPALITFIIIEMFLIFAMVMSEETEEFLPVVLGMGAFWLLVIGISTLIQRKQYKCYKYDFYKTKVVYRDSFLNICEKEVKYKFIREVTLMQGFIQRAFNLGTIVLFTNAESGFANGIRIVNIENPKQVYSQIKETIGDD